MRLYLTKHSNGLRRDITDLAVSWSWSGDKASISRQLEVEIAFSEGSGLPVPEIGDLVTMEETKPLFIGVVLRRSLGSEDHTMSATCFDYGIYLQKNDCTAKFTGAAPEEITRSLCAGKDIPVASLPATGIPLRRKFSAVKINQAITTIWSLAGEKTGKQYAIRYTPEGLLVKASIRKRGNSYLIVVSMGYDYKGARIKPRQKTVHPPQELTPKQREKWLQEQAVLFERSCRDTPEETAKPITLAAYIDLWLREIAPRKLAKSTIRRDQQDIVRILPALGHYKLTELRPEYFRAFYAQLRETVSTETKKPLSEYTVEGVHATLCSILSDAVEGGFLRHNPAWRTYRYAGRKTEKKIADAETVGKIIAALEDESLKYETYFKLVIATGMRRGECCALQWGDINWERRSIHICRNTVKVTDEEIFTKAPKTVSGDQYVYFSLEMESLLRDYRQECAWETETYDGRELEDGDFLFRRKGCRLPMTPSTFTWRFKLILKKHGLPEYLNVHSLRHTNASLLIANGTDVATVAGLLGHSQPSTTLDIYTHAFDKNKQAASRALQEGLEI